MSIDKEPSGQIDSKQLELTATQKGIDTLMGRKVELSLPAIQDIPDLIRGMPQGTRQQIMQVVEEQKKIELLLEQFPEKLEEVRQIHRDTLTVLLSNAQENTIDPMTRLQNRNGVFQRMSKLVFEKIFSQNTKIEKEEFNNMGLTEIVIGDNNNFKLINSELGETQVNKLLAKDGQIHIGVAQFLSGENENTAYGSNINIQNNRAFLEEFPQDSPQYKLLEMTKENGILIERFRIGGDEFAYIVHYQNGYNDKNGKIAELLLDYLSAMIVLPKKRPNESRKQACDRIGLMCESVLTYPRSHLYRIPKEEEQNQDVIERADFYESLGDFLQNTDLVPKIINDPHIILRMDADLYGLNAQQAFFDYCKNPKIDLEEKADVFQEKTLTNAAKTNVSQISKMYEMYNLYVTADIIGNVFDRADKQIRNKKNKNRIETLIEGYKGNPHAFLKLAGLINDRVLKISEADTDYIYHELNKYYLNLYINNELPENGHLKKFFDKYGQKNTTTQ